MINFWGYWCAPCRAETAQLQVAPAALDLVEVAFLGIDVKGTAPAAPAFDGAAHITYPSIFDPTADSWQALSETPISSVPVTLVLDDRHALRTSGHRGSPGPALPKSSRG